MTKGSPEELRHKKIVTPLHRLLISLPVDDLLSFFYTSMVNFSLSKSNGAFHFRIHREGKTSFHAHSHNGPKGAIVDCMARFLVEEKEDFHKYMT